ncbi:MAG TPA: glycerol-3-phosphate acyltransferase [Candidatus Kapabacteria bacterium]|nr:glycerol-3-phosphate acyltransferase [Candidatus Kapabacteria bacterium]
MIEQVLIIIFAYLVGSIPFSAILVKLFYHKNLTEEGSYNVGALNSYEVSNSKFIGILSMLLDASKGMLIVLLYHFFFNGNFDYLLLASIWVVIGHIMSIFLKLKGGRGLATAAGLFLLINPYLLFMWLLMWVAGYKMIRKNVHVANSIALLGTCILAFSTNDMLLGLFDFMKIGNYFNVKILFTIVSFIILLKHIKPLRELFNKEV